MSNKLEISQLEIIRRIPLINAAFGILPVASFWDTAPTNLLNCTDNNLNSVTGTGTSTVGAAAIFGRLSISLPSSDIYLLGGKVGVWSSTGAITIRWESTPDGITSAFNGVAALSNISTTEQVLNIIPIIINGNIFNISFRAGSALTGNVKIYELWAFFLGL